MGTTVAMDAEMVELLSSMLLGIGAVTAATVSAVALGCGESKQKKQKGRRGPVSSKSKKRGSVSSRKKHAGSMSSKSSKSVKKRHASGKSAKKRNGSSKSSVSSKSKSQSKRAGGKSARGNGMAAARSGKSSLSSKRSSRSSKSASKRSSPKRAAAPTAKAPQRGTRQEASDKSSAKPVEVHVEPKELYFSARGGQRLLKLYNGETTKRFAVKTKCSDNELYRVNPVYTFLEPGQKTVVSTYRHAGISKIDKLVFIVAEVGMDEVNPSQPFRDSDASYPMMVVPLITSDGGGCCALAGPEGACVIGDRQSATANEPARVLC